MLKKEEELSIHPGVYARHIIFKFGSVKVNLTKILCFVFILNRYFNATKNI